MRKILAMMLTFCTVFSSVCTIVLAQEQSLLKNPADTVSGNEAVRLEDTMVSGDLQGDGNEVMMAEEAGAAMAESDVEAANTVSGGDVDVIDPMPDSVTEGEGKDNIFVDMGKWHFWYIVDENGIVITWAEPKGEPGSNVGEVVVPEQIEGVDGKVYRIGRYAFGNFNGYKGSFSLPDSITEIGSGAFAEIEGFTMTLPFGLYKVEERCFMGMKGLTGELPAGLTEIADRAFASCSGLEGNIKLPQGITEIGPFAFCNCSGFSGSLELPEGLERIGHWAFFGCRGLTGDLVLPNGLKEIGSYAFGDCTGLSGKLVLPEGILEIGDCAFTGCPGLVGELKLPESLRTIGQASFWGYNYEDGTTVSCGFTGNLVIPDNVEQIGERAFAHCDSFSGSLKLSSRLTEIKQGAFYKCSGLSGELILPDGLTEIGAEAFYECSGLTGDLRIPDSVKSIGASAFQSCNSLGRNIYMTGNVNNIENDARNRSAFERSYDQNTGEHITVADITIHAPRGSYAETYAVENGYSYTDDNGYVHVGTGNNGNKEPGESDVTPAFLANTTDVKIQTTTKRSDADKAVGIQSGEYLQVEISDAVNENVLKELNKAAVDKGLIISKVFNIELKVLEQSGKLIRKVSESKGEFTFTIPAPEGMNGDLYDFFILRYHGEGISILPDLDSDSSTVTFASDKFSAYAIAYKAKESNSGNISTGGSRPNLIVNGITQSTVSTNDAADSNENASDGDSANSSSDGQRAGGQAGRDSVPRTGDELPIAVPAAATVIFAVLSCIFGGQELFGKRAEKTGKC